MGSSTKERPRVKVLTDEAAGEAAAAAGVLGRVLLGDGAPELRLDAVLEVRVGADDPENLQGKT